jgi:branched-chain amino acid transport system substrate-binding protein
MRKVSSLLAIVVTGVILLSSIVGGAKEKGQPIKIGSILAITGPLAQYGMQNLAGAQLALDKLNAEGGVKGREIELVIQDHAGSKTQAVTILRKFVDDPRVLAVLGTGDTNSFLAVSPIAGELRIPILSPGSSGTWKGEFNKWTFRCTTPTESRTPALLRKLVPLLGIKTAAILYEMDNEAMVIEMEAVKKGFSELGVKLVATEAHRMNDTEFAAHTTKIMIVNPDVVFMSNNTNAAGLSCLQLRSRGYKGYIFGGSGWCDPRVFDLAKGTAEGAYTAIFLDESSTKPQFQDFAKAFKAKYGDKEVLTNYHAFGYDGMLLLGDALKRTKKLTREAVRDALGQTKNLEGACTVYSYNNCGDNLTPANIIVQIKGNKYVPVK